MIFDPRNFAEQLRKGASRFLYGAGIDYNLSKKIFVPGELQGPCLQ